jgi:hypothetical protein
MVRRLAFALALATHLATSAHCAIVDIPYTQWASTLQEALDEVSQAKRLSYSEARWAEHIAAEWVFLGPCKGSENELRQPPDMALLRYLRPSRPMEAAALEMMALVNLENLGRGDSEYICRFAREKANSR